MIKALKDNEVAKIITEEKILEYIKGITEYWKKLDAEDRIKTRDQFIIAKGKETDQFFIEFNHTEIDIILACYENGFYDEKKFKIKDIRDNYFMTMKKICEQVGCPGYSGQIGAFGLLDFKEMK